MPLPTQGFVNPGYAVAENLQEILARKTAEKRQALIDAIANRRADADQLEAQARLQESAARIKDAQTRETDKWVGNLPVGYQFSPEEAKRADEAGYSGLHKQGPIPGEFEPYDQSSMGEDVGPAQPIPKMGDVFLGTREYQDKQAAQAKMQDIVNDQTMDPLHKALMLNSMGMKVDPSDLQAGKIMGFDEASGKLSDLTPAGYTGPGHFFERSRPPQGPQESFNFDYVRDAQGHPTALIRMSNRGKAETLPLPTGIDPKTAFIANQAVPPSSGSSSAANKPLVDQVLLRGYGPLKEAALRPSNQNTKFKVDAGNKAAGAVSGLISSAMQQDPVAAQAAATVLQGYTSQLRQNGAKQAGDIYDAVPAHRIPEMFSGLTPDQAQNLTAIILAVRGR